MKYIKAITWSIVLLIVLVALFAVIKIWGITLPEGWNMSVDTLINIIIPSQRTVRKRNTMKTAER